MAAEAIVAVTAPLVSIGLPVYNGARSLEPVLRALAAQDHTNIEIVVSDNGSTDDSVAIARSFAATDPRVRVYAESINRGAVWNFNRVLELAAGDYLLWAAHDDLRHPAYVSSCLAPLLADGEAAVCHTRISMVDANGAALGVESAHLVAEESSARQRFARTLEALPWQFAVYGVIRMAHLKQTRLVRNYYGSDLGLVSELAIYGKILQLQEPLFTYCQRPGVSLDAYLTRLFPSLDPRSRYRPWLPLRAIMAGEQLASIKRAPLPMRDQVAMAADVMRQLALGPGTRDDLLRMVVAAIGPARVERWRARRRQL